MRSFVQRGVVDPWAVIKRELWAAMDRDDLPTDLRLPVVGAVRDEDWFFVAKYAQSLRRSRQHATADYLRHLLIGKDTRAPKPKEEDAET